MKSLQTLALGHNRFTSSIPSCIDGQWTSSYTVPRCPDHQDIAFTDINAQLSIPWNGVTCSGGKVVALNLKSLGAKGLLPSFLGLLISLTSLVLSSNGISGVLTTSLGQLTNLVTLELASNQLTGSVPSSLSRLSSLIYLDLRFNRMSKSIPNFLATMTKLVIAYVDGNRFGGEINAAICEAVVARNLTLTMTNNPLLTCYQPQCWSSVSARGNYFDPSLIECVPTQAPTMVPTAAPTAFPTQISSSQSNAISSTSIVIIVVLVVVFVLAITAYLVYRFQFSAKARKARARLERLSELPVHRALLGVDKEDVYDSLELVRAHLDTVNEKDADGDTVLNIILSHKSKITIDSGAMVLLLESALPFDVVTGEMSPVDFDRAGWVDAVQHDEDFIAQAVEIVLEKYPRNVRELTSAVDAKGRCCLDIASPTCKVMMLRKLYLHGRYDVQQGPPEHRSATSAVYFAKDHVDLLDEETSTNGHSDASGNSDGCPAVALKFMKHRDQFEREVGIRAKSKFNGNYVLDCLRWYDGDSQTERDVKFRKDAILKGYEEYPYCVVMEAGSMNLKRLIDNQNIAGKDWDAIKTFTKQIAQALQHIHYCGVVHGDLKALNILQVGLTLKLIDFDAAVTMKDGTHVGLKYSSAFLPPEMFWKDDDDMVKVRSVKDWTPDVGYDLVVATPAHDMWSLGCVLFLFCTGMLPIPGNVSDQLIYEEDSRKLWEWTEATKRSKLDQVKNHLARNLVSLLLMKSPRSRLDADHVLSHPFLTGVIGSRLPGTEPMWDVFLSYRVDSDSSHVEDLYHALTGKGLKVWWDKKCLLPGQNWEEGFCSGLVSSRCLVCLLSRDAIKCPMRDWHNIEKLVEGSRCDNVLLEWRLALDLKERGMIEGIFPVMIGDKGIDGTYSNYFTSACNPSPPDIIVKSIENKLHEHLGREGLGSPYVDHLTVKSICTAILSNQGGFYVGKKEDFFDTIIESISSMVDHCKASAHAYPTNVHSI
eukprot:gene36298-biopygen1040